MRRITFAILTILCMRRLSVEARENISVQEPQIEQTTENYSVELKTGLVQQSENEKRDVIRKCCPLGKAYNYIKRRCLQHPGVFDPPLYENRGKPVCGANVIEKYKVISGFIKCLKDKEMKVMNRAKDRYLLTDGQLYVDIPENIPSAFIYGPDKYCIDTFVNEKNETQLNALICFVVKPDNNNYAMSSSCMLISCFFILLTVAVYAFLPELRNLHGMVLMAYLLSFFVGFLFFATMQILILKKEIIQRECTILTFIIYFSLLSAFFWLNVMCYDIWWTFSGKRATSGRHGSVMKRFYCYAGYAFGVPTILTVILAALEFSDLPMQHPLLPMLRRQGCFLYGTSKLIYLYGPIVILCVANMIFFTLTAIKIARIKKDTEMLRSKDSSTHDQDRKDTQRMNLSCSRFSLYVKLFAVMGVNWILEVVSSFYPEADFFWQFSDAYNVLVGLIIFIIFVCKKKTFKLIKKRVKDFRKANTNNNEVTNISNKIVTRWRKGERNASVETIKTSVGGNTRNTTNDIFQL
ncbi:probable G-protein coupled receptor Mth-like 10 isoform X6 [Trichoplusia ni]|uniref:Probable G-protein coupled receptor Mth-like 10 isoform X6 n=1 Tax=Trichoplusia ni TaxID=7111 RepID=A0A7E5WDN1_TRINI|nr:probable G-protein coupled receptor Mth-like 10 isoform X6 [Trichoplusia ni]